LEQHIAFGFAKDNPFAVRRVFCEVIAHAVVGCTFNRLRFAAFAVIEWNLVQVEKKRLAVLKEFLALLRSQKHPARASDVFELVCPGPCKNDVFTVGTPAWIALHKLRIIRSRQRFVSLCLPIIYTQNTFNGKKELGESQLRLGHEDGRIFDGAEHKPAVRRYLRKQTERLLPILFFVIVPRYYVAVGVIHIHCKGFAVRGKRVTISADRQILQNDRRLLW